LPGLRERARASADDRLAESGAAGGEVGIVGHWTWRSDREVGAGVVVEPALRHGSARTPF